MSVVRVKAKDKGTVLINPTPVELYPPSTASTRGKFKRLSVQGQKKSMSVRASLLRIALFTLLIGILLVGKGWESSKMGFEREQYHSSHISLSALNRLFKNFGWLISAGCWAILLGARYFRQKVLQENVNWRRHAWLDAVLWTFANIYWFASSYIFELIASVHGECQLKTTTAAAATITASNNQEMRKDMCMMMNGTWIPFDVSGHAFLTTLAICLLAEEIIRFIGEPIYYFTMHAFDPREEKIIKRAKLIWWTSVGMAILVISAWMVLFIRTAFFYHTFEEKLWGTIFGYSFWTFVVIIRFVLLYT